MAIMLSQPGLFAYGQDKKGNLFIGETFLDMEVGISAQDLQNGMKALDTLGKEEQMSCRGADICTWHHVVPEELQKQFPLAGYEQIGHVFHRPYFPYALDRYYSGLEMLSFVPAASATDGPETVKHLNHLAETGELFDCFDPAAIGNSPHRPPDGVASAGRVALQYLAARSSNQENHDSARSCLVVVRNTQKRLPTFLSLCELLNVRGLHGAPERCFPILASDESGEWILAKTAFYYVELADNGRPDFSVNLFRYEANREAGLSSGTFLHTEDLLRAAESALSDPPLSLTTTIKNNVLGVCSRRNSIVLGRPWSEEVTVRVDVSDSPTVESASDEVIGHNFSLEVSTSILVNEQKDPSPNHWHAPSTAQAQSWNDAIRQSLNQRLSHLCNHPARKDDFTVVCEKQ